MKYSYPSAAGGRRPATLDIVASRAPARRSSLEVRVHALILALALLAPATAQASWDNVSLQHYFPDLAGSLVPPQAFNVGINPNTQYTFPYTYGIVDWPVTVRVRVQGNQITYVSPPAPPVMYAELNFQAILIEVSDLAAPSQAKLRYAEVDASQQTSIDLTWPSVGNQTLLFLVQVSELPHGLNALTIALTSSLGASLGELPLTLATTPPAYLDVHVNDGGDGLPTPARVSVFGDGLFAYAKPDPAVIAAQTIPVYDDFKGTIDIQKAFNGDNTWPLQEKRSFYTRGRFELAVRPGTTDLVVSKGIEYERYHETIDLVPGQTAFRTIALARQLDLPATGWYSADDHVHVGRTGATDDDLIDWCRAEDVHFANTVQMGDVSGLQFLQGFWGVASQHVKGNYLLRSAQEDPRTNERGHALMIGNTSTHWSPQRYFIYEDVFDQTHLEGGLAGYAHDGASYEGERGLAIDVPLGKSDFIEMQINGPGIPLHTQAPYDWWNLGFKQSITSGSDFPFADRVLGLSLFYAYIDPALPFTFDGLLDAIKEGRTYATNGPVVDFTVNGALPGTQLDLSGPQVLSVSVHARLNPTLGDELVTIELISQGDVVAQQVVVAGGEHDTTMTLTLPTTESRWIAARVTGQLTLAHTTPVYVVIDGKSFWRADELLARVPYMEVKLDELEALMANDTIPAPQHFDLQTYIDQARAVLQAMIACPVVAITPPQLVSGSLGVPYVGGLSSPNGVGSLLFVLASGNLPAGLSLGSDGALFGTPAALGSSTFTVQVTDIIGCVGSQAFALDVFVAQGSPCAGTADCASGYCVDGVCCDAACDGGVCDACSTPGGASVGGTCALLSGPSCDDGDACTQVDACQSGACVGASVVVCAALDTCHDAGSCDPLTGACDDPSKAEGAPCEGGTCSDGVCFPDGAGGGGMGGAGGATTSGVGGAGGAATSGVGGAGGAATSGVGGAGGAATSVAVGVGGAGGASTSGAGAGTSTSGAGAGTSASGGGAGTSASGAGAGTSASGGDPASSSGCSVAGRSTGAGSAAFATLIAAALGLAGRRHRARFTAEGRRTGQKRRSTPGGVTGALATIPVTGGSLHRERPNRSATEGRVDPSSVTAMV